ncbi:MAG: hypothetical protein WAP03_25345 [Methylorubrum rhodinum]|uniref:hypothetical protein n=1 Tax=Methylorubrum rhodinum TaxID=29428 RepID=UPI003BAEA2EE
MPNRAAVDTYTGLVGEPVFDGDTLRMHNGTVQGGIRLLTAALLGATALLPTGALTATPLAGLFGRTLTALDRGAKPDAVVTATGAVSGTDNSTILNAYAQYCLDNDLVMVVPPGDYFCVNEVKIKCNYRGTGARLIFANNSAMPNKVSIENVQGDTGTIDIREVRQWTGFTRRSRKLGNLGADYVGDNNTPVDGPGTRKGQYIHVDTTAQSIMPRVGGETIQFGEGFLVADDDGGLAHMISGNANNAIWSGASVGYKIVRERITIEGLHVVIGDNGTAGTSGGIVVNNRPNVSFKSCEVNVVSTKAVGAGFVDDLVCSVTHEDGRVTGLRVVVTNYGWNSNLSAGIVYRSPKARFVRRGIDAHRSKHIDIESPQLPDGWGCHYAWWMGSRGGLVGASTSANPQALHIAGGGFSCVDADMPISGSATSLVRARADMMECGDSVVLRGNRITIKVDGDAFRFLDFQGSTTGPDNGRTVEWPRLVSATDNVVTIHGANMMVRVVWWGLNLSDEVYKYGNEVNSRWNISGNQWKFVNGDPLLNGVPRLQIFCNKAEKSQGDGVFAYLADFPSLFVQTVGQIDAQNKIARFNATIERIDDLCQIRWGRTATHKVVVNVAKADILEYALTAGPSWALQGDEAIGQVDISRLSVTPTKFEAQLENGAPLSIVDTPYMVNALQVTGGTTGSGPKLQAVGSDANVGMTLATKGTGSLAFGTADGTRQMVVQHASSAVNYWAISGAAAGAWPKLQAAGSDTNVPLEVATKGSGSLLLTTAGGTRQAAILHVSNAVNYPTLAGGLDGSEAVVGVGGSGTTGHLGLTARGSTGTVRTLRPLQLNGYLFAQLPTASTYPGASVRVIDRKHRTATSDGTQWLWSGSETPVS